MRKYLFDISLFILIFLFSIFALSNIGFIFKLSVNPIYIIFSFLVSSFVIYKKSGLKNSLNVILAFGFIFLLSFIFSNFFIDTSFDGRCYHFTTQNLLKSGYNPIYDDIKAFASKENIFYNLLFSESYPNLVELLRANFYLIFNNMEASKVVNFLFMFGGASYAFYFFSIKTDKFKALILTLALSLCPVVICQMNTKMVDFIMYYIFIFQLFSLILINKNEEYKFNTYVFVVSSIMAVSAKYTGVLNTFIIFGIYLLYKFSFSKIKIFLCFLICSLTLCFQPYFTNIIKFKNPFYPSVGFNKKDFMTKQNPVEFQNKNYIYKFARSMFSSASDSRLSNLETPKLYWKIPFTSHFDMPYTAEDVRINGFGHLYSGIFILTVAASIYLFIRKKKFLALLIIYLATFLNPVCWWARFVPWLYLSSIMVCYYLRKKDAIFYIFSFLLILNGCWVFRENISVSAYKTFVMNKFYENLFSQNKKIFVYMDKNLYDEDDATVLPRMREYGIDYELVDNYDDGYKLINTDCTISKSYRIKY